MDATRRGDVTVNQYGNTTVTDNAINSTGYLTLIDVCGAKLKTKTVLRYLYIFQLIDAAVLLGVGGAAADGMTDPQQFAARAVTGKLVFNLFVASATILGVTIVMIAEHAFNNEMMPAKLTRSWLWLRLGFSLLGLVCWIFSIWSSVYNCSDLCSVTGSEAPLLYAGICCDCAYPAGEQLTNVCFNPNQNIAWAHFEQRNHFYEATTAFDVIEMVLVLCTVLVSASAIFAARKIAQKQVAEQSELNEVREAQPSPPTDGMSPMPLPTYRA